MLSKSAIRRLRRKFRKMGSEFRADHRSDELANKVEFVARVSKCAENGEVAVVYGGIDCDGGRWDDCVQILPAIPVAVQAWINEYYDGAEGPQWTDIRKPSAAAELEVSRRDLALEAFENGHPHCIHY